MDIMVWAGNTAMRVTINKTATGTPSGKWDYEKSSKNPRPVFALGYQGGAYRVVVADDDGRIQGISQEYFRVV